MNREAASRQINGFESNNEARATGNVVCAHWADSVGLCAPGVGFSRFNGGPGSRFIGGLPPLLRLRNQRDERPGAPSSALKVSPVNERKRVRFFTASPVIKHEADRGKPGISGPLNKRARQLRLGAVTRAFAPETAI